MITRARNGLRAGVVLGVLMLATAGAIRAQSVSLAWNRDFVAIPVQGVFSTTCSSFTTPNGPELFLSGDFGWQPQQTSDAWIGRWTPTLGWRGLGPPYLNDLATDLIVYDDGTGAALYACGWFTSPYSSILRWRSATGWEPLSAPGYSVLQIGPGARPNVMLVHDDGSGAKLYVAGRFNYVHSIPSNVLSVGGIVGYDHAGWHPLASGVDNGDIYSMVSYDDGSGPALIIAGSFSSIGGSPISRIARWQNGAWSAMGSVPTQWDTVNALGVLDTGAGPILYAGAQLGSIYMQRWDGAQWVPVSSQPAGYVTQMFPYDDGRGPALFCYVSAASSENKAQRFDGHVWMPLGQGVSGSSGLDSILDFTVYDAGRGPELHMCGGLNRVGGYLTCDGLASWANLQPGISRLCPGDGSYTYCPCGGAFGAQGRGCPNSFDAGGGDLAATGMAADDTLTFQASSLPTNTSALIFQGDVFNSNSYYSLSATPRFGDGLRCTAGNLRRMYARSATNGQIVVPESGASSVRARAAALGDPLPPGASRLYQAWYRDLSPTFCDPASTWNTTNAIRVVW